jgi:hypothetical protein
MPKLTKPGFGGFVAMPLLHFVEKFGANPKIDQYHFRI